MAYIDFNDIPDLQNTEALVEYLTARDSRFCADKIRMFAVESEKNSSSFKRKAYQIIRGGFCYTDERFLTGWIERDGTLRSNDYTCHDEHIYAIGLETSTVERMGWIHVSTHECTATFKPSAAQVREMRRINKWYNDSTPKRRWIPINPSIPVGDQLAPLYADF